MSDLTLEATMPGANAQKNWPQIIGSVNSIMALSALALLAAGAAFTAVLVQTPQEKQFWTFLVMIGLLLIILFSNMFYAYIMQRHELTFRLRVARMQNGVETPCEDTAVEIYRNEKLLQSSATDEMGILSFTVKLERKDELYAIVLNPETGQKTNRAALYSAGQCQMIKTIRLQ
jgi:Na+/melibiose symporter-like transporter